MNGTEAIYGLEAIANANGWVMAVTGASIVMTGLTVLSIIISQLPKVVAFMEKRQEEKALLKMRDKKEVKTREIPGKSPLDIEELAIDYKPLAEELGESFELRELHALCRDNNLPHSHLSIRNLRDAGILIPRGDGVFTWNK